ncbi:hypothetical protein SEA_FOSTEROUS_57 [Gordonia phage Fosterous]|uniref:Helix-turn-helix DNA binding domain protein n=1 Tax=Gordonia phage Fosterous TaxID=2483668 RepID=A0A3G3M9K5_9CAUD|nr:replication initiation protein [Gordonia phage Fosterous]AYR02777.1 hypothetical protein SEA_FOSTEROUS_57 [Gordonia phage Fosterous]
MSRFAPAAGADGVAVSDRWFKVDTSIVRNPKVLQLSRTQRWALIELWAYSAEDLTDGVISRTYCDQMIGKRLRNVLLEHGFLHWIEPDKTLQIHDYLAHQQSREQVLATSQKRRAAGRKGGAAKAAKAKPGGGNLLDDPVSNLPPEPSSKIVADKDQDKNSYLRKSAPSPNGTRAHGGVPLPPEPVDDPYATAGTLALVPALPDRRPDGRRIPKRTRNQMLAELNATARSVDAARIASAFEASLGGRLDRATLVEIGRVCDGLLRDGIPPAQIAAGITAWHDSDRLYPSQIPRFVAKAARTSRPATGKPTAAAVEAHDVAAQLIEELGL